ncbi:hypothetical protein EK21DRAFT_116216 [Setomelanomma holmii]|uniref:Uncharacterized protein n=1 Tax=Setomelanomma holmii TaxID=210430 RepID=A0A9P4H3I1_9PLEO|nr:hypothetical protein EK21DRAFT_116216 [Setomelanomma holmii]
MVTKGDFTLAKDVASRHISLWLKGSTCTLLAWQNEEGATSLHYHRVVRPCYFLLLPKEIKFTIADYAMFVGDVKSGELHIAEARGQMQNRKVRITSGDQIPRGNKDDAFHGHIEKLRPAFNSIHHIHSDFESYRGKELLHNTVVSHGYSFDSFIIYTPKKDILKYVREVRLFGEFSLGLKPQENPGQLYSEKVHFFPKDAATWDDEKDSWRLRKILSGSSKIKTSLIKEYGDEMKVVGWLREWYNNGICSDLSP